jgi:hypothetical protein
VPFPPAAAHSPCRSLLARRKSVDEPGNEVLIVELIIQPAVTHFIA